MVEGYEMCDRCGCNTLVCERHKDAVGVFVLCPECMDAIKEAEDRLDVLEGFFEEVGKMTKYIK